MARSISEKTQSYRREKKVRAQRSENKFYLHVKEMHTGIGWGEEEETSKVGARLIKITNSMVEYSLKFLTFERS